jgi:hypothetical protein
MTDPFRRRAASLRAGVVLSAILVGLLPAAVGFAASPSPSSAAPTATPSEPPFELEHEFAIEAWLDADLPAEAQPGTMLHVGAFVWIRGAEEPMRGATFRVFLHPASGSAEPSFDYAFQDFAGHLLADIAVPEGGVGTLDILQPGTICENDVCTPNNEPIPIQGVGPPPGVRLSALAQAFVSPPIAEIRVGQEATFEITVQPRIDWPAPGLVFPATLWLQARVPQGAIVADVEGTLVDAATGRYEAAVTFDQPGEYVIQVGTVAEADGDDLFGTSLRRITVAAASSTAPAPGGASGDASAGWALPALVVALAGGLGLLVMGRGRTRPQA